MIDRLHPQLSGCIAWWPMLEGTGLTARDRIGLRHGTLTNFTAGSEWAAGKDGTAPNFAFSDNRITFAALTLNLATGASVTWRSKRSTAIVGHSVFGNSGVTNLRYIRFSSSGQLDLETDTSGDNATATLASNDTLWHSYAMTCKGTTPQFYQDGIPLSAVDATITDDSAIFDQIGLSGTNTADFSGLIDNVRVYSRVLSQAEIHDIMLRPWAAFIDWDDFIPFAGAAVQASSSWSYLRRRTYQQLLAS